MTTSQVSFRNEWVSHPIGKAARIAIAVTGLITSTLVLLLATFLSTNAAWLMVLLGVALAATSIRAAVHPTMVRLITLAASMVAIPIAAQII